MWCTPKMCELDEALQWIDGVLVIECTLPLDVETAIALQILGDRAAMDAGLELTILARLEE